MGTRFYPPYILSPGGVWAPRPGANDLILDQIPGAIAAWSTRRLISSAPEDIARGRDAATTEQDFTAAELAGSGFTTLAGAGDGFYVTLYDQIGSNNATQSTAGSQPKGVSSGTLITDGVIPVLRFDGVNDSLEQSSQYFNIKNDLTVALWFKPILSSYTNVSFLINFGFLSELESGNIQYSLYMANGSNSLAYSHEYGSGINETINTGITFNAGQNYTIILTRESISKELNIYVNGANSYFGAYTNNPTGGEAGGLAVGNLYQGTNPINANMNDVIIFNRALSEDEISKLHTALS